MEWCPEPVLGVIRVWCGDRAQRKGWDNGSAKNVQALTQMGVTLTQALPSLLFQFSLGNGRGVGGSGPPCRAAGHSDDKPSKPQSSEQVSRT